MTNHDGVSIAAERADRVRRSVYDDQPPQQERWLILMSFAILLGGIALVAGAAR